MTRLATRVLPALVAFALTLPLALGTAPAGLHDTRASCRDVALPVGSHAALPDGTCTIPDVHVAAGGHVHLDVSWDAAREARNVTIAFHAADAAPGDAPVWWCSHGFTSARNGRDAYVHCPTVVTADAGTYHVTARAALNDTHLAPRVLGLDVDTGVPANAGAFTLTLAWNSAGRG